jgi:hypothetical protein
MGEVSRLPTSLLLRCPYWLNRLCYPGSNSQSGAGGDVEGLRADAYNQALSSEDPLFHNSLYDWLISRRMTDQLLEVCQFSALALAHATRAWSFLKLTFLVSSTFCRFERLSSNATSLKSLLPTPDPSFSGSTTSETDTTLKPPSSKPTSLNQPSSSPPSPFKIAITLPFKLISLPSCFPSVSISPFLNDSNTSPSPSQMLNPPVPPPAPPPTPSSSSPTWKRSSRSLRSRSRSTGPFTRVRTWRRT